MAIYAQNNLCAVSVSPEAHGGCGTTHRRPVENGAPARLWALDCEPCSNHLRHDPQWSTTLSELPETFDEKLKREDFEKRGALDERKLMAMALAQMVGIPVPDTISGAVTGMMPHIPGVMECGTCGSGQLPGKKFCADCGAPMSQPVTKAALPGPERPAEPPVAAPSHHQGARPVRIQDLRHDELQAACRARGLPDKGVRKDLMKRLRGAGVSNADLQKLLLAAA